MPYEAVEVPAATRCLNKRCVHMYGTHYEGDGCDLCSCDEFNLPFEFKPRWVPNDTNTFEWLCLKCHGELYGVRQPGMTSREPKECYRCSTIVTCCMVDRELVPSAS